MKNSIDKSSKEILLLSSSSDSSQNEFQENKPKAKSLENCNNELKSTQSKIYDLISTQAVEMLENAEATDELSRPLEFKYYAKQC